MDNPVSREIHALLSEDRLILRRSQRAVTPFGPVAVFVSFLDKIAPVGKICRHMRIPWRSPDHIDPTASFTAFLMSLFVPARRLAHASLLRGDRPLHALLGLERFPTGDTIRNLFGSLGLPVQVHADQLGRGCSVGGHASGFAKRLVLG